MHYIMILSPIRQHKCVLKFMDTLNSEKHKSPNVDHERTH